LFQISAKVRRPKLAVFSWILGIAITLGFAGFWIWTAYIVASNTKDESVESNSAAGCVAIACFIFGLLILAYLWDSIKFGRVP
jgi:hypothetical protein